MPLPCLFTSPSTLSAGNLLGITLTSQPGEFGAEPFSTMVRSSNILNYKYDWIWQKTRPSLFQHANKRPMKDHENIMVFYKKQPTYNQELKELEKPNKRWRKNKMGAFFASQRTSLKIIFFLT